MIIFQKKVNSGIINAERGVDMGYIKSFIYEFNNTYTVDDRLITILFASIFLPWPITAVSIIGGVIYILIKSDFMETIRRIPFSKVLIVFSIYLLIVSLFNSNWLGALLSIAMFAMFVNVIHYRRYIHKDLFEQIIDIAIILSVVAIIVSIFEQMYYTTLFDGMGFFDIQNKPQFRVHLYYYNANYYAMMILFIESFCIYKFFKIEKLAFRFYYVVMGILNLFALYLTGGRIAWLCLACAVLVMLVVNQWYKLFGLSIFAGAGTVGLLALKPTLLPRLAAKGLAIERRKQIWQTAILIIQDSWLFGRGPLTYYNVYGSYTKEYIATYGMKSFKQYKLGISSQHAHTMFLEPLVSFGIVGTIILAIYLFSELKYAIKLISKKIDHTLAALLFGAMAIVFTFCIIDFPVFWIQTGFVFLLLLGSADIYSKELKSC